MTIRDRILRLEGRGIEALAERQQKVRTLDFLRGLSDDDLEALEDFCERAEADPNGLEAHVSLTCASYDDLMAEVRKRIAA